MRRALLLAILLTASPAFAAPSTLCGWYDNPTPGNHWLTDKNGQWIVSTQMGPMADGVEIPDFGNAWIATNGGYGFGCACIKATVDTTTRQVKEMHSFKVLPLKRCQNDKNLSQKDRPKSSEEFLKSLQ